MLTLAWHDGSNLTGARSDPLSEAEVFLGFRFVRRCRLLEKGIDGSDRRGLVLGAGLPFPIIAVRVAFGEDHAGNRVVRVNANQLRQWHDDFVARHYLPIAPARNVLTRSLKLFRKSVVRDVSEPNTGCIQEIGDGMHVDDPL